MCISFQYFWCAHSFECAYSYLIIPLCLSLCVYYCIRATKLDVDCIPTDWKKLLCYAHHMYHHIWLCHKYLTFTKCILSWYTSHVSSISNCWIDDFPHLHCNRLIVACIISPFPLYWSYHWPHLIDCCIIFYNPHCLVINVITNRWHLVDIAEIRNNYIIRCRRCNRLYTCRNKL